MVGSKTAVRWALAVVLLAPLAAAASGGGPNSSGTCVAWMNASLDSAVLVAADLSEQTVVSSPTPLVFVGDEGELKASFTVTPSTAGPFASVRLSLSGISFTTFAACATGTLPGNPAALSNLVVAFDEADEADGIEEVTAGQPVSLEIRLDVATGLESDGAGCITGNFVADPTPAFEAELEDDLDNEEDLEFSGAIVSLGASDFVVDVNGAQVTVLVDANTEFDNIAGLGDLAAGDLVVVTELEHHSSFVPWQYVAGRTGAAFRAIPIDESGELRLEALEALEREGTVKVVASNLVSNTLGTINPVERLAAWAHDRGAIMVVDAAQAAPHRRVDVQALGCDFLAFSSHKMCGPSGAGALWGRRELLETMSPFNLGGEMIRSVSMEKTTWNELPYKFEAGTPPIGEAVGMGAAIDYLTEIGMEAIEEHEHDLAAYALERLADVPGVHVFGPPAERRAGIVSFDVEGVHPHDVAQILDWEGVAIRAGHHCCQPLMARLGVAATNRASFYLYTIPEEIDRLVEGLHKVRKTLGNGASRTRRPSEGGVRG